MGIGLSGTGFATEQQKAKVPEEVLKRYKVNRVEIFPNRVRGYVTGEHLDKREELAEFFISEEKNYRLWEGPSHPLYRGSQGTWMVDYGKDGVVDEIFWQLVPNLRELFTRDISGTWYMHWDYKVEPSKNIQAYGEDMQFRWDLYWTLLEMDTHVKK